MKIKSRVKLPNLRRSRLAHKIVSQTKLAVRAGVPVYAVLFAELGRAIQLVYAVKITQALGVKLQSLRF